jgi:tetratricopeptide (TPR) repeat protein
MLHQLLGDYTRAQACQQQSADLFSKIDRSRQARSLNALAYSTRLNGQPAVAEEFARQALIAAQGEGQRVAATYTVLGCLAYDRLDWSSAEKYWQRSLDLWRVEGDSAMVGMRLRDLGTALYEQKAYAKAIAHLAEALTLSLADGDIWNVAISRMNLGNVYLSSQQPETALDLYRQAEVTFRSLHDYRHLAMCYNNQGLACRELGQWSNAEAAYHAAVEQWQRVGETVLLADTLIDLGDLLHCQEKRIQALAMLDEALARLGDRDHPAYNFQREKALTQRAKICQEVDDSS